MNTSILRQLDTLLGLPLAWLAGLLFRRHKARPVEPRQVVVVKLFGMGSIIIAASALRQFKHAQPQARITLVTFAQHAEIGSLLDVFDETMPIVTGGMVAMLRSTWNVLWRLRSLKPDLVVDLEYFSKLSTVFCSLLGAKYRLGFHLPRIWRSRLLDDGIAFREDIHFGECVGRLLHKWNVPYWNLQCTGVVSVQRSRPESEDTILRTLTGHFIVVNPNAHDMCSERRWPLEKYAELMTRLLDIHASHSILIVGSATERRFCEQLRALVPERLWHRIRVCAGETSLSQLSILLTRARLLVTNDSGIMHMAAALSVPLVALFGPESPIRYGPLCAHGQCIVIASDVACGPCLSFMNNKKAPCLGRNICMAHTSVSHVFKACIALLGMKMSDMKLRRSQSNHEGAPRERCRLAHV